LSERGIPEAGTPKKVIDRLYYRSLAARLSRTREMTQDGTDPDDQAPDLTSRRRQ